MARLTTWPTEFSCRSTSLPMGIPILNAGSAISSTNGGQVLAKALLLGSLSRLALKALAAAPELPAGSSPAKPQTLQESANNASKAVESGNAEQAQAAAKPKASFHEVTVALANLTGDAAGGGCCCILAARCAGYAHQPQDSHIYSSIRRASNSEFDRLLFFYCGCCKAMVQCCWCAQRWEGTQRMQTAARKLQCTLKPYALQKLSYLVVAQQD